MDNLTKNIFKSHPLHNTNNGTRLSKTYMVLFFFFANNLTWYFSNNFFHLLYFYSATPEYESLTSCPIIDLSAGDCSLDPIRQSRDGKWNCTSRRRISFHAAEAANSPRRWPWLHLSAPSMTQSPPPETSGSIRYQFLLFVVLIHAPSLNMIKDYLELLLLVCEGRCEWVAGGLQGSSADWGVRFCTQY